MRLPAGMLGTDEATKRRHKMRNFKEIVETDREINIGALMARVKLIHINACKAEAEAKKLIAQENIITQ